MLNEEQIVRAWKDPDYRASLSQVGQALLPLNPVGELADELSDDELAQLSGGEAGVITIPRTLQCTLLCTVAVCPTITACTCLQPPICAPLTIATGCPTPVTPEPAN